MAPTDEKNDHSMPCAYGTGVICLHCMMRGHVWKFAALDLSTSLAEQQSGWQSCWSQRISVGQLTSGRSCGNDRAAGRGRQSDWVTWTCGIGAAAVQLWRLSSFWRSTAICRVRYLFISVVLGRVPAPNACIYVQNCSSNELFLHIIFITWFCS
jgi:hypothetical protein